MTALVPLKAETQTTVLETVRVLFYASPLSAHKSATYFTSGQTIAQIVDGLSVQGRPNLASSVLVYLEGHPVPRANWTRVRPKGGATMVVRVVVEGPLFAAIGAVIGSLTATIAASTFLTNLAVSAVLTGASMLLNALFPVRQPQLASDANETGKQAYSLTSSRNQAEPYGTVPVVFGEHRVTPSYGARPFTESIGDEQYFRGLFVWCQGRADIQDIRIGETPIGQFADCQIENAHGSSANEELSLFTGQVVEESMNVELDQATGWVQRRTATNVNEITADIQLPNGLYRVLKKDGSKREYHAHFVAQYKSVDTHLWTEAGEILLRQRSLDPLRRTFRIVVAPGQYDFRVRRVGPADHEHEPNDTPISRSILTAVRGSRPARPITYSKPLVKTAIRIRASQQLNGSLDTLNGVVRAFYQNIYNGGAWVGPGHSRNPADALRQVLQGVGNARPIADALIDFPALEAFWRYCNSRGYTYDAVISSPRSVRDMVQEIASAGRAFVGNKDGKWSVVMDEDQPPIVQMFTPRNSWGFESTKQFDAPPHGFKIRFVNRNKGWIEDERIVYDDGYSEANATLFEALEFPGLTDADNVWRFGRFHLAQLRLRPETVSINVDWENLVVTRGDRVRVVHDVMLIGQASGRVRGFENNAILLDEPITVETGKRYTVRFRHLDLSQTSFTYEADQLPRGTFKSLPSGTAIEAGAIFTFGEAGADSAVYRVLSIEQNEDFTARLTLVDDAPDISLADRQAIPPFNSSVRAPVDPFFTAPVDLIAAQEAYALGSEWYAQFVLSWVARTSRVAHFEVGLLDAVGGGWRTVGQAAASQPTFTIADLPSGTYRFRVRSIFVDGTFSQWTETSEISTDALLSPPEPVANFRINTVGDMSTLTWDKVPSAEYYEIRQCKIVEGVEITWNGSTPIQQRVSGTSFQVPTIVGAFLIKAVKGNGVRSRNATVITTNVDSLSGHNVVEVVNELGFTGRKELVSLTDGYIRLAEKVIGNARLAELEGFYYFDEVVDLAQVYTSRLSASIVSEGADLSNTMDKWARLSDVQFLDNTEPDEWSVEIQYRHSQKAPADNDWSDWQTLLVGDSTARAYQFRLKLSGNSESGENHSAVTPFVHSLNVVVDMPDIVRAGNDIPVAAAGRRITFDRPFAEVPSIAISAQNVAATDKYTITNKDRTGFNIRFTNTAGNGVAASIDYVAKGYGIQN